MTKNKPKEQRILFTIKKNKAGKMAIGVDLHPKLAKSKEAFEKIPMDNREMQNAATDIVKFVMQSLAERDKSLGATPPEETTPLQIY